MPCVGAGDTHGGDGTGAGPGVVLFLHMQVFFSGILIGSSPPIKIGSSPPIKIGSSPPIRTGSSQYPEPFPLIGIGSSISEIGIGSSISEIGIGSSPLIGIGSSPLISTGSSYIGEIRNGSSNSKDGSQQHSPSPVFQYPTS